MSLTSLFAASFGGLLAHAGQVSHPGFLSGLAHPIFGLDHLVAIFCVGLLSLRRNGSAAPQIPLVFLAFLLLGGWVGLQRWFGEPLDVFLSLSVIAAGLALLFPDKVKGFMILGAVVGITAFLHGYAHGAEAPSEQAASFFAGFSLSTLSLLAAGLLVSLTLYELRDGYGIRRGLGGLASVAGAYFLLQVLTA